MRGKFSLAYFFHNLYIQYYYRGTQITCIFKLIGMETKIRTIHGLFTGSKIIEDDGNVISCYAYGRDLKRLKDKIGFYNIKTFGSSWVIIQDVLE